MTKSGLSAGPFASVRAVKITTAQEAQIVGLAQRTQEHLQAAGASQTASASQALYWSTQYVSPAEMEPGSRLLLWLTTSQQPAMT